MMRPKVLLGCLALAVGCGGNVISSSSGGEEASALSGALTGFVLVDTDTHEAVAGFNPIPSNAVISQAAIGTKNVSIVALASSASIGSVVLELDANYSHVEDVAPYSLCGDEGGTYSQLVCSNLGLGAHKLSATAWSGANGAGTQLATISLSFSIVASGASSSAVISGFALVNTDTHAAVSGYNPIPSGASINLASIGASHLAVQAIVGSSLPAIGDVVFELDGDYSHTENAAPYSLCGDDGASFGQTVCTNLGVGSHSLSATAYASGIGNAIGAASVSFSIAGSSGGGSTPTGGSGTCSPSASGPGGAGSANVAGSNVPAFPKLTSAYTVTGLDASGNTDASEIIQAALNAHSQVIIPGSGSFGSPSKYKVVSQINVPAGVIIECETGAEFLEAVSCPGSMPGMFLWTGAATVTGAGMYGCMFKGTAPSISTQTSYNHSFIRLNSGSNYTILGNYTTNSCGDADIRLDGPENSASNHGSTHNLVAFNDMEHAENGIALINAWNNTITCNTAFNGSFIDEEPNHDYAQCGDNTITLNYMKLTTALPAGYHSNMSIGGNGTNCPAGSGVCATDTVTHNVIDTSGFSPAFTVYCECNSSGDACDNAKFGGTWSNNILTGGTRCTCGDAC